MGYRVIKKICELGEVVGGATPSTKVSSYWGGDISWISPKDLAGYGKRYISYGERNITQEGLDSCSAIMLPKGTILFSSRAPIGYTAIASQPLCTNQGFKSVVPNRDTDSLFLYYLLKSNAQQIASHGSGTTFKEISGKAMREIELSVPADKGEQKKIASILDSIDTKIELNNRINDYLEELCDAIYQDFVNSNDESWRRGTLNELLDIKYGKDHKKLADGPYPVYGSGGYMRSVEKPLANGESVLIPRKGSLNNVMYVNEEFWTVDTMFFTVPRVPGAAKYAFQYIKKLDLESMNSGSAVPSMTTAILNALELPIPDHEALRELDKRFQPMYKLKAANKTEIEQLSALRDAILPKLMSGEIDVSNLDLTQLNNHLCDYLR